MTFWITLAAAVLLVAAIPYLRCFCKRIVCAVRLAQLCRERGYRLHKRHALWFLGSKRGHRCDCHIETNEEIYAIKLFGVKRRTSTLIFTADRHYIVREFLALVSIAAAVRFPLDSSPKPLPDYDFRCRERDTWKIKTPRSILLVNPVPLEIRRRPTQGGEIILGSGSVVDGLEIHALPGLIRELERTQ